MNCVLLCSILVGGIVGFDDVVTVSAVIQADALEIGGRYDIKLSVEFHKDWSASGAGMPAPLLQIKVPPSARLVGKVLTDRRALSRNEYLRAPFERQLVAKATKIPFTLERKPDADDHFVLNVLAYVSSADKARSRFVRHRLRIPLSANAVAETLPPDASDWGGTDTLQIGESAAPFTLPRADGSKVSLSRFFGKQNVIVTTYRAHW